MNYEEVFNKGLELNSIHKNFFTTFEFWEWFVYLFIFITLLSLLIIFDLPALTAVLIVSMVFVLPFINFGIKKSKEYYEFEYQLKEYKNNYGDVYISNIKKEKYEIIYMKIDNSIEVTGSFFLGNGYINSENYLTMIISYKKENEIITNNFKVIPKLKLSEDEISYISFSNLNKELPYYEKGLYEVELYLPKNYKFNDIK